MKKQKIIIFVISISSIVLLIILNILFKDKNKLFDYNLMEVLTACIVTVGIFLLTQISNEKNKKNMKIETLLDSTKKDIYKTFLKEIKVEKLEEYLSIFKRIDNKIRILSEISEHLNCEKEIKEIGEELEKISVFIIENISEGNDYFKRGILKYKIPNIINNIDVRMDNILIKIYNN